MDISEALELDFESILKETEKAYQIKFDSTHIVWLPKSQIRIMDDIIYMPKWIVKEKQLENFIIK